MGLYPRPRLYYIVGLHPTPACRFLWSDSLEFLTLAALHIPETLQWHVKDTAFFGSVECLLVTSDTGSINSPFYKGG
jgi:hypothetical protein